MVFTFRTFLIEEEQKGKKLKHLTHLEDMAIHHGHDGIGAAYSMLQDMHNHLTGKGSGKSKVSTKYDGAPSIVFGRHPKTGQFFVASKSAFNKDPKINYTEEDIERNHGHAPGLVAKLKAALKHLPKVAPQKGVYQGDLMHTPSDIEKKDGQYHFTPNAITYSTNTDSAEGKKAKNSKLGVVIHTKYEGKDFESMSATPNVDRENFKDHPDVHNIDPKVNVAHDSHYTPEMQREFQNHMENAKRVYSTMSHEGPEIHSGHESHLEAHVNNMVRKGKRGSTQGYIKHLQEKMKKEMDKVKTPAAKERKQKEHQDMINHVVKNKDHFNKLFELHKHLANAKDVMTKALASTSEFDHKIGDQETGPEGFVVTRGEHMAKFVNRGAGGFAQLNLTGAGKISQAKKAQQDA
jgi:hypothetical protein